MVKINNLLFYYLHFNYSARHLIERYHNSIIYTSRTSQCEQSRDFEMQPRAPMVMVMIVLHVATFLLRSELDCCSEVLAIGQTPPMLLGRDLVQAEAVN